MNKEFRNKLKSLNNDYQQSVRKPFEYFFCPFLYCDENVELCKAHIINKSFNNSSRKWTIQRKDIDNFFGSNFESDFSLFEYHENITAFEALRDKKFTAQILLNNKSVDYYYDNGNVSEEHTKVKIEKNGVVENIVIKMPISKVKLLQNENWEIEHKLNLMIPATVSLIKAAHLTMFNLLGYSYVLSKGGHFIGNHILGNFFLSNQSITKKEVLKHSEEYFGKFQSIVRPIRSDAINPSSTITSKEIFFCQDLLEPSPWAFIVFIKLGEQAHAVLLPYIDSNQKLSKYISFIENPRNIIPYYKAILKDDRWEVNKLKKELFWPENIVFNLKH